MSGSLWSPQQSNIALQAGQGLPQPVNPLAIAGQVQDFQRNQLAIQSAKQTLASQNALGRIAQSAINADGSFNSQAFATGVKNDPDAAYGATEAVKEGQGLAGGQYGLNQDNLSQTTNRTNAVGAGMAGLLSNPNLAPSDIYGSVAGQAAAGKPVGAFVSSVLPSMPTMGNGEAPSAYSGRLKTWLAGVAGQAAGPEAAIRTLTPNVATVGLGGTTQTVDTNPYTNPRATNTSYQNTLSPEAQVSPVDGQPNAMGGATKIPTAAFAASQGLGGLVPGGGSAFGTGRPGGLPSGLLNPNRPAPAGVGAADQSSFGTAGGDTSGGSQPVAPGAPAAPMTVGLGPGQKAGMEVAGNASASQWSDLGNQVGGSAAGGGSAGRIYMLQHAQDLLQKLGPGGTGTSAPQTQALVSYISSLPGINKIVPQSELDSVSNYDSANKVLSAYASARAGSHGGTTDSQLATTLSSNASTHISNLAAQGVVSANIGLERMDQAQFSAFQNAKDPQTGQPLTPDQFTNWSAGWNRNMDPRAFVADQLPPQQLVSMVSKMAPAERAKFQNTYSAAIRNGWMDPPAYAQTATNPPAPASDGQPSTADIAINPGGAPPIPGR